uniref:Uncharacterized protein n=1 Tax=Saccharomyces pastorianus TaxID=27292 RepID=P78999_SACPS|nr:unknown [Saccharomyces pastorianus]
MEHAKHEAGDEPYNATECAKHSQVLEQRQDHVVVHGTRVSNKTIQRRAQNQLQWDIDGQCHELEPIPDENRQRQLHESTEHGPQYPYAQLHAPVYYKHPCGHLYQLPPPVAYGEALNGSFF